MRRINVLKAIMLLVLICFMAQTVTAASLVSRWRMDDNAATTTVLDSSGNDYHGTFVDYTNPNTSYHHSEDRREGSGSLMFDGSDSVQTSDNDGILGPASRTCTAWIKTSSTQTGTLLYWGTPATGQAWFFRVESSGVLSVNVMGGSIKTTATVNDGQWHHVAAVLNNDGSPTVDEIMLYIDGQLQQNTTVTTPTQAIDTVASQDLIISDSGNTSVPALYNAGLRRSRDQLVYLFHSYSQTRLVSTHDLKWQQTGYLVYAAGCKPTNASYWTDLYHTES